MPVIESLMIKSSKEVKRSEPSRSKQESLLPIVDVIATCLLGRDGWRQLHARCSLLVLLDYLVPACLLVLSGIWRNRV